MFEDYNENMDEDLLRGVIKSNMDEFKSAAIRNGVGGATVSVAGDVPSTLGGLFLGALGGVLGVAADKLYQFVEKGREFKSVVGESIRSYQDIVIKLSEANKDKILYHLERSIEPDKESIKKCIQENSIEDIAPPQDEEYVENRTAKELADELSNISHHERLKKEEIDDYMSKKSIHSNIAYIIAKEALEVMMKLKKELGLYA